MNTFLLPADVPDEILPWEYQSLRAGQTLCYNGQFISCFDYTKTNEEILAWVYIDSEEEDIRKAITFIPLNKYSTFFPCLHENSTYDEGNWYSPQQSSFKLHINRGTFHKMCVLLYESQDMLGFSLRDTEVVLF
jgi:hypothetical protein